MMSVWSTVLTICLGWASSDHLCILFDLIQPSCPVIKSNNSLRYNVYGTDFDYMKLLLSDVKWEADMSVTDCWDYFSTTLNRIMRNCVPLVKPKKCKKIYMTNEAIKLKNKKNQLWRLYTETKSLDISSAFKHVRDSLRSLTRQLRCDFEKRLADNIKTDSKCFGSMLSPGYILNPLSEI